MFLDYKLKKDVKREDKYQTDHRSEMFLNKRFKETGEVYPGEGKAYIKQVFPPIKTS